MRKINCCIKKHIIILLKKEINIFLKKIKNLKISKVSLLETKPCRSYYVKVFEINLFIYFFNKKTLRLFEVTSRLFHK